MDPFVSRLTAALEPAYTLGAELTGGGMSRVFLATERALGRKVVVKVLPPELAAGVNRDRFRREIQLAANLQHPHVVPLLNAGEDGELLWYTMPFIEGESLKEKLQREGPLSVRTVLRVLHDVVDALVYAHDRGVIHRDIKPGNILTHGHHSLVTDFGVAKALSAALPTMAGTSSGMAIGTPAYMAPEQLAADPAADHRVDLYAVGLLAYELLTGRSPFEGLSPTATMAAQLTQDPDPLSAHRTDLPPALARLVERCLAKLPDRRPASAAALLEELEQIPIPSGGTPAGTPAPRRGRLAAGLTVVSLATLALVLVARGWGDRVGAADSLAADTAAAPPAEAPALTRADSLAIARALRDQLAERPRPSASAPAPATGAAPAATPRSIGLTEIQVDSIVRASFREAAASAARARAFLRDSGIDRMIVEMGPQPPPEGGPPSRRAAEGPARVTVRTPERVADPRLQALSEALGEELRGKLSAAGIPSAPPVEGRHTQVIVNLDVVALPGDSVLTLIKVRNVTAEPDFSYRVSSSRASPVDAGPAPHQRTLDEAVRQVQELLPAPSRFRITEPPVRGRRAP